MHVDLLVMSAEQASSPPLVDIAAVLAAFFATPADLWPAEAVFEGLGGREVQGHRQHDARALLAAIAPRLPERAHGLLVQLAL